jgi:hypothetical protein
MCELSLPCNDQDQQREWVAMVWGWMEEFRKKLKRTGGQKTSYYEP